VFRRPLTPSLTCFAVPTASNNRSTGAERRLVIVESPAKARTIAGYLGPDFVVESSIGHIRDLPERAADIPSKYKKEPWARLGVDTEHDFQPLYVVDPDKKHVVAELKKQLANADELLLATDEDREGEAIAWHLVEVLQPKIPVRRMVFHEITSDAIQRALDDTRDVDRRLVDAQETRRILDRLYGYEVSPVLWKKITKGLSAGRVQSVATRLVVERERARIDFVAASFWDIDGVFDPGAFTARLVAVDGRSIAQGRDFGPDGQLAGDLVRLDEEGARSLAAGLADADFAVRAVERKPYRRRPAAPFMTSTLQQEASRKLRFSSQTTMRVAQRLYENGYITYMRTDSTTLAESAVKAAREQARSLFGAESVPADPRRYDRKVKNAQEAHEAIRPAGDSFRTPDQVARELEGQELALYDLVWRRTIASQMADATGETVSIRLGAKAADGVDAEFATSGTVITFRGFLAAYEEGRDEAVSEDEADRRLPPLETGQELDNRNLEPLGHVTTPPPRYTEATLVRALEERGIGRPSTYASIMGTILDRGYVFKKGTALVPSYVAFAVVKLLESHFDRLVDYEFTARMEDVLDRIAVGEDERVPWLRSFYFGENGDEGLKGLVSHLDEIDAREMNSFDLGGGVVVRVGRYGPFLERDDRRASIPDDLPPDELTLELAEKLLSQNTDGRPLGTDPETGREIVARDGRYGPYVTEVLAEGEEGKPRTGSLFKTMSVASVTLEEALRLLSLPRVVGVDPSDDQEITALNGRYGPYLKKGEETRSLDTEEELFTIGVDDAAAAFTRPKTRGRRGASTAPLRTLGPDPTTKREITLRSGRYGPYVTDGETNASLKNGDDPETVTIERAAELLADRRAAPKRTRRASGRTRKPRKR
jgi:DNA topoisomerase I